MTALARIHALREQAGAALWGLCRAVAAPVVRGVPKVRGRLVFAPAFLLERIRDRIAGIRRDSGPGSIGRYPITATPDRECRERCATYSNHPHHDSRRMPVSEVPRRAALGPAAGPGGGSVRAWRAALVITVLAGLFAAPVSAQTTLTATHPIGGDLYEGDYNVPFTITGFNVPEAVGNDLRLKSTSDSQAKLGSDFKVEGWGERTARKATVRLTFHNNAGAETDETLKLELYYVTKTEVPGQDDREDETLIGTFDAGTLKDGLRPGAQVTIEPTAIDLPVGVNSVDIKVSVNGPPKTGSTASVNLRLIDITGIWGFKGASDINNVYVRFTSNNWQTPQTVTIEAVTAGGQQIELSGGVRVDTYNYWYAPDPPNISFKVTDKRAVPQFSPDSGTLTLVEGGLEKSYTVKLDRDPGKDVTLQTTLYAQLRFKGPGDTAFGESATLEFTGGAGGNWKTPQTISVKHVDDGDGSDTPVFSINHTGASGSGGHIRPTNFSVALEDGGSSPVFNPDTLMVTEGEAAGTYKVKLNYNPVGKATLTINVPQAHQNRLTVQAPGGQAGASATLTFTTSNWNQEQTINVTATDDDNYSDETVTLTHTGTNLYWPGGVVPTFDVQVMDRGGGKVEVSKNQLNVFDGKEAVTYTVRLSSPPADEATVTITSADTTKLTVSPTSLTFNAGNYQDAQTVSLTALDGEVDEGDTVTVSHAVTGYDATTTGPNITAILWDTTVTENLKLQFTKMRFSGKEGDPADVDVALQGSSTYTGFLPAVSFRVCFQDGEASVSKGDIAPLTAGENCVDRSLTRKQSDGVDAPSERRQDAPEKTPDQLRVKSTRRASMEHTTIIGIDISKRSFQLHGATAEGKPVFRKSLSRGKFLAFLSKLSSCLVVMEACGGAHHWGREITAMGHECKLIPPVYVKPFVKRQKNDQNDAAAIVEAAQRPTMRFVAVKSEEAQADAMLFRTRALLVRQRTQTINSLRGHLAEFGLVAPRGTANVERLRQELAGAQEPPPEQVAEMAELLLAQIDALSEKITGLDKEIRTRARGREEMKRLMTIPGIGPICAMAVHAFAPPMASFRRGRDFASL